MQSFISNNDCSIGKSTLPECLVKIKWQNGVYRLRVKKQRLRRLIISRIGHLWMTRACLKGPLALLTSNPCSPSECWWFSFSAIAGWLTKAIFFHLCVMCKQTTICQQCAPWCYMPACLAVAMTMHIGFVYIITHIIIVQFVVIIIGTMVRQQHCFYCDHSHSRCSFYFC